MNNETMKEVPFQLFSRTLGKREASIDMEQIVGNHDILFICLDTLRYVDRELGRLFEGWKARRKSAFVICLSDHGTCYGEDGCHFHGLNHPVVNTVPYKHFLI